MRNYKIESYVPEENFYQGKDAHFWRAAFEDCFVLDVDNNVNVVASCSGKAAIDFSPADMASLLGLFEDDKAFLILSAQSGTLLVYPAWRHLKFALAFLLKEDRQEVTKAYESAQRCAFSALFDTANKEKNNRWLHLENKLCTLQFYIDRLFGDGRQTNVTAHVLMIANLVGCQLHETVVSRVNVTLDERELELFDAYLFCTFMTMRRYSGKISALTDGEENADFLTHAATKYGLRVEQSVKERIKIPTAFDVPSGVDIAGFAKHPLFADYRIEESNGTIRLHIPLKQKALLSSITAHGTEKEITLILFPLFNLL